MHSAFTFDVMKSYLTRVWDKKIRNGYNITLKTRFVWDNTIHNKGCYVINTCTRVYLQK